MENKDNFISNNNIDYYSDTNDDVIGKPPKKIIFYSNITICFIVIGFFLFSLIAKYPTRISIPVNITYSNGTLTAYSWVQLNELSKIQKGQAVDIKLSQFPYEEYGILKGAIDSKTTITKDTLSLVRLSLPLGIRTSKGIKLDTISKFDGTGEITLSEKSILKTLIGKNFLKMN